MGCVWRGLLACEGFGMEGCGVERALGVYDHCTSSVWRSRLYFVYQAVTLINQLPYHAYANQ